MLMHSRLKGRSQPRPYYSVNRGCKVVSRSRWATSSLCCEMRVEVSGLGAFRIGCSLTVVLEPFVEIAHALVVVKTQQQPVLLSSEASSMVPDDVSCYNVNRELV